MLLGWGVSVIAGASLGAAAQMQGVSLWVSVCLAMLPLLVHALTEWRQRCLNQNLSLMVDPDRGWQLNYLGQPMAVTLQWGSRHLFGLTLSVKNVHHPHRRGFKRTLTVWRQTVDPQDYRRLCILYTWFIRQPALCNVREKP